nr:YceD family protein [Alteraurantiacibacter buctensis]
MADAAQHLVANEAERAALARRFSLVAIDRLEATVSLVAEGERVKVTGELSADVVQSCAVTGDDLPVAISEPLAFTFVPTATPSAAGEEVELAAEELDEIPYDGALVDVGEAVAEELALAIDPYAEGPGADEYRRQYNLDDEGPKGALAEGLAALLGKKD